MTKSPNTSITLDALRVLIWPIIFALVYAINYQSFSKAITLLPTKIAESTKISIGNLVIEQVEKVARSEKKEELLLGVRQLSPQAISTLLQTNRYANSSLIASSPNYLIIPDHDLDTMEELIKMGQLG